MHDDILCMINFFAGSPIIVSIFPNSPQVSGSPSNYVVPEKFSDTVVTCTVFGVPSPTAEWLAPSSVTITSRYTINSAFVSIALEFTNGFTSNSSGRYDCIVHNSTQSESVTLVQGINPDALITSTATPCQVSSSTISFQLRVLSTDCMIWDESQRQLSASDFQYVLTSGITSQCETCVIDSGKIAITHGPDCSKLIDGATVFEGVIRNEKIADTKAMFCALRTWWRLQPLVRINDDLQPIDINCVMQVDSSDTMECPVQVEAQSSTTVAFSVAGGVVLLIIISGFILVNVFMIYILPRV